MKTLLGWLGDPIVHLLLVAVVMFQIATHWNSGDNSVYARSVPSLCTICNHRHCPEDGCDDELLASQSVSTDGLSRR